MPPEDGLTVLPYLDARSQGDRQECTAFATVAGMESWVLAHRQDLKERLPLSEADLFAIIPGSRDSLQLALAAARVHGIVETSAGIKRASVPPEARGREAGLYWHVDHDRVPDARRQEGKWKTMMECLSRGAPLVTSIYVDREFFAFSRGVYRLTAPRLRHAHAICIVGFDVGRRCWIAKNSMGSQWGAAGGCFAFAFGDRGLAAEHTVWSIERVIPPSIFE